ncbi:MAG: alpha/beta hydrolase fold domain-containing protein [Stellaceae bacterium]
MPNAAERKDPHASPLQASRKQLEDRTLALIIMCENDVLRDEGKAYA